MAGKADIVTAMAEKAGISKKEAEAAYNAFLEHLTDTCVADKRCAVPGLGVFTIADRAAREGNKPGTTEKIQIPASRTMRFKAGKDLRTSLNAKAKP